MSKDAIKNLESQLKEMQERLEALELVAKKHSEGQSQCVSVVGCLQDGITELNERMEALEGVVRQQSEEIKRLTSKNCDLMIKHQANNERSAVLHEWMVKHGERIEALEKQSAQERIKKEPRCGLCNNEGSMANFYTGGLERCPYCTSPNQHKENSVSQKPENETQGTINGVPHDGYWYCGDCDEVVTENHMTELQEHDKEGCFMGVEWYENNTKRTPKESTDQDSQDNLLSQRDIDNLLEALGPDPHTSNSGGESEIQDENREE